LYGERPFEGETLLEMAIAVRDGRIRDAPKGSRVSPRIRRALLKGLSVAPEARHPSMDLLLSEIRSHPVRSRRIGLTAAGIALVIGAVLLVQHAMSPSDPVCSGADRKLAGIWDEPRKRAVRDALLSTGRPLAGETWARVESAVDRYAAQWVATHTDACQATRVRGEQSEQLLDLRMACLERRRKEIHALTEVLIVNADEVAARAVQAASALGDLRSCADVEGLSKPVPPPAGDEARASVDALSTLLSRVKAMSDAGRYDDAYVEATGALASARALGYRPAEAEALFYVGELQSALGDAKAAEETLVEAVAAALAGRDDTWLARATVALVWVSGSRLRRFEEGRQWAIIAEAAIERQGGDDALSGSLAYNLGSLFMEQQRHDRAHPLFERALLMYTKTLGEKHPSTAAVRAQIGRIHLRQGRLREALEELERAKSIQKEVGSTPLDAAVTDLSLAQALHATGGDRARARSLAEGARDAFKSETRNEDLAEAEAFLATAAR
jgi:tetratricopeptide (TPR) repeat protein